MKRFFAMAMAALAWFSGSASADLEQAKSDAAGAVAYAALTSAPVLPPKLNLPPAPAVRETTPVPKAAPKPAAVWRPVVQPRSYCVGPNCGPSRGRRGRW